MLSRQPGEMRQFLARTAILGRYCAPLCDAVVGSANAAEIIDVLERENLFLMPLDDNRQWYRYHHLFAQALRSQLARTEPDVGPSLHARASAWHRLSGSTDEAIGHALAADDTAGTVDLIVRHWFAYVDSGRAATVRGWMHALGGDRIAAHPLAAHSAAWLAALSGEAESVRHWIHVVRAGEHDGPLPDGMPSLEFSAALLGGLFGFDGIRAMRESAARARELASAARLVADDGGLSHTPQNSLAHTATGAVYALEGRHEEARSELKHALQSRRRWPGLSPWPTLEALLRLAPLLLDIGDRQEAAALLDEARDILIALPDGAEAQLARLEQLERRIAVRQPRMISVADPLTEREVAVLRLLEGTLPLREIASELHLSQNTVKTHTRVIYRKLGVSTRRDAVAKGRAIGIA